MQVKGDKVNIQLLEQNSSTITVTEHQDINPNTASEINEESKEMQVKTAYDDKEMQIDQNNSDLKVNSTVSEIVEPKRNPDKIYSDSSVIIQLPSGNSKIINFKANRSNRYLPSISDSGENVKTKKVMLGKFGDFDGSELLGKFYGIPLEILDRGASLKVLKENFLSDFEINPNEMTDATNEKLVDNNNNQTLTPEELLKLKNDGLAGNMHHQEIIQKIVSHNETFSSKTEFSKAKYILKKLSKYSKVFTPQDPTALNLMDYYNSKSDSAKIRELRADTLSQMLAHGNIRSGSRVLIFDDVSGLLTLAALECTRGVGDIIAFHAGLQPNIDCLKHSNLPESIKSSVTTFAWYRLFEPFVEHKELTNEKQIDIQANRLKRHQEIEEKIKNGGYDALLVASIYNVREILDTLQPLLAPCARICMYDPRKEALLETYNYMRFDPSFCNTSISESWMRSYQVPVHSSGTHPDMGMTNANSGFLISATLVSHEGCVLNKMSFKEARAAKRRKYEAKSNIGSSNKVIEEANPNPELIAEP